MKIKKNKTRPFKSGLNVRRIKHFETTVPNIQKN
jgi:hypothetical protein